MIIETTYDTSSKILEVKADGKKIKNVVDVVFMGFSGDNEFFMDITTIDRSKTDDDGVTTRTHIMASEDGEVESVDRDLSAFVVTTLAEKCQDYKNGRPLKDSERQTRKDLAKAFN